MYNMRVRRLSTNIFSSDTAATYTTTEFNRTGQARSCYVLSTTVTHNRKKKKEKRERAAGVEWVTVLGGSRNVCFDGLHWICKLRRSRTQRIPQRSDAQTAVVMMSNFCICLGKKKKFEIEILTTFVENVTHSSDAYENFDKFQQFSE